VRGLATLREVDRRVEVRAAVLGGREVVGRVLPAARGSARARLTALRADVAQALRL
jgi:hypothetical protein